MSVKGTITKSDYLNFDTATNKAVNLLQTKNSILGLYIIVSINTGLRADDVLNLKWSDLKQDKMNVIEGKTKKPRTIAINDNIKKALASFDVGATSDANVFISQKGGVFSIQQINRKLKALFINEAKDSNISTHSLRKTFGRRVYQNNQESEKALIYLSELFNHTSLAVTRIYLGIRQEELNSIYMSL